MTPTDKLREILTKLEYAEITYGEAEQAITAWALEIVDSMPERGFAVPKEGTPSHAKGTFTKLISAEEIRAKLTGGTE